MGQEKEEEGEDFLYEKREKYDEVKHSFFEQKKEKRQKRKRKRKKEEKRAPKREKKKKEKKQVEDQEVGGDLKTKVKENLLFLSLFREVGGEEAGLAEEEETERGEHFVSFLQFCESVGDGVVGGVVVVVGVVVALLEKSINNVHFHVIVHSKNLSKKKKKTKKKEKRNKNNLVQIQ